MVDRGRPERELRAQLAVLEGRLASWEASIVDVELLEELRAAVGRFDGARGRKMGLEVLRALDKSRGMGPRKEEWVHG
jgi:hypothetical protein